MRKRMLCTVFFSGPLLLAIASYYVGEFYTLSPRAGRHAYTDFPAMLLGGAVQGAFAAIFAWPVAASFLPDRSRKSIRDIGKHVLLGALIFVSSGLSAALSIYLFLRMQLLPADTALPSLSELNSGASILYADFFFLGGGSIAFGALVGLVAGRTLMKY